MILLGRDLSPFVRRCATLLNVLNLDYERMIVAAAEDGELIRQYNPLGRIPALILDTEVIIDSAAIVDHALQIGDADHVVLPSEPTQRREVLRASALATGTMEKGLTCTYEITQRPSEFMYEPYRHKLAEQVTAGLTALENSLGSRQWFGTRQPNLADINAVVAFDYIAFLEAELIPDITNTQTFTNLAGLSARTNALPAFASTRWRG